MATIRPATMDDLDLLVEHRQRMWQDMGSFTKGEHAAACRAYRRWLRPRLSSGRAAGFIVEAGRRGPVSSGVVWLQEFQPRPAWGGTHQAYLMSVFTEPADRGKGHATRITKAAMRWARQKGVERMALHASKDGAGIYRALGFKRTHEMRLTL